MDNGNGPPSLVNFLAQTDEKLNSGLSKVKFTSNAVCDDVNYTQS